ncbi:hypothetical protein HY485_05595 [Candidatus Woesearchaeota archaeon]|nr:hypothetical protein [Candidatus Woesearchaeota archaeon]
MKKFLIISFFVLMIVFSVMVVAQQARRRPPAIDAAGSVMSLPGKSTTAYGWHGGAAGSSASPKAKMSRPTESKSSPAGKPSLKGAMPRLTGRTGFSRHTIPQNSRGPKIAITGKLVSSSVSRSTNRARFAQSGRKSSESSSSSASTAFEGSESSGQSAGGVSGAGTGGSSAGGTSAPTPTPTKPA